MARRLVNNNTFSFFLTRYFVAIIFCFLTLFVTGRLGDIDYLLGLIEYQTGGTTSAVAKEIFSQLGFIGNRYLIIGLIAAICSFLLFILLNSFIDKNNRKLWILILMSPGLLLYTNSVTKETLFIYPAIAYIILESFYLTKKETKLFNYFLNIIFKIILILFMISVRGDLSAPYIVLFFLCIVFKNIYFGDIFRNLKFGPLFLLSFIISFIFTFSNLFLNEDYFARTLNYLGSSFRSQDTIRPTIDIEFIKNQFNYLYIQYLSLFPTPLELIYKPYKITIVLDSFIIFISFSRAWKSLFNLVNPYKKTRQIIAILFTFVTVLYFSLYGIIGSFNLGSSQRLRTNWIPIGIVLPLVIEKMIRDKKLTGISHL